MPAGATRPAAPVSPQPPARLARAPGRAPVRLDPPAAREVRLPASRLTDAQLAALRATGAEVTSPTTRHRPCARPGAPTWTCSRCARVLRRPRRRRAPHGRPGRPLLRSCAAPASPSCPFGGGTSVVGGVAPLRAAQSAVIALDLRRLDRLLALSEEDRDRGPRAGPARARGRGAAERPRLHPRPLPAVLRARHHRRLRGDALRRAGLHRLRPLRRLVLGDDRRDAPRASCRSAAAPRPPPDPRCCSCSSAPRARSASSPRSPSRSSRCPRSSATTPGSSARGRTGIAPAARLEQSGVVPDVARLSDATRRAVNLRHAARPGPCSCSPGGRCLLVLGWEGTAAVAYARRKAAKVTGIPLPGAGNTLGARPVRRARTCATT